MPSKEFIETFSLYRKYRFDVPLSLRNLPIVSINMWCPVDESNQTFNMTNPYHDLEGYADREAAGSVIYVVYRCASCEQYERCYFLNISEELDWIQKVGQFPSWDVAGDANIERMLGSHASYYKRGLITESQGYGIAAFAYYRRIVEEIIDELLEQIADLIPEAEQATYQDALARAKNTRVTSDKIDLVKDMLPPILRPGGMNPLGTLHSVLSEGLHAESDENCLELAASTRQTLAFLTSQVASTQAASKAFTEGMRKLLERKRPG
jgi:hypothetical protein